MSAVIKSTGTVGGLDGHWCGGWGNLQPPHNTEGPITVAKGKGEGSGFDFLCYNGIAVFIVGMVPVKKNLFAIYDYKIIDMSDCWRTLPDEPRRCNEPIITRRNFESLIKASEKLAALRYEAYKAHNDEDRLKDLLAKATATRESLSNRFEEVFSATARITAGKLNKYV
jgi:hypothetical protein